MAHEFTYNFQPAGGLVPRKPYPFDMPLFEECSGLYYKDGILVPFDMPMHVVSEDLVVYHPNATFFMNPTALLAFDNTGNILIRTDADHMEWKYFRFGPNILFWDSYGRHYFFDGSTVAENALNLPSTKHFIHVRGQPVCASENVAYVAKVGTFDFELAEQNEAGQLMFDTEILCLGAVGDSFFVGTDAGLYKCTNLSNMWGRELYKQGVYRLAASNDRQIILIEDDGTVSYIWHNGESQVLGFDYIGKDVISIEELPYMKGWLLNTLDTSYLLIDQSLTCVGTRVAGWGKVDGKYVLYTAEQVTQFSALSTTYIFNQMSLKHLREVELIGHIKNREPVRMFFQYQYTPEAQPVNSQLYTLLHNGTSVVHITAPYIKIGFSGPISALASVNSMKLRYQRADLRSIRGIDNATAIEGRTN